MKITSSILLLLVVSVLVPIKTNGQAALLVLLFGDKVASENFYFSLKAGANISNITDTEKSSFATGFNFGLLANIKLSDRFYLVPEFAPLSPKGAKNILKHTTGSEDLDNLLANVDNSKIELNYIDIPIVLKYYPTETFNIGFGPYFSFLTSANNYYNFSADGAGELEIYNKIESEFSNFDFGLLFEIAYAPWRKGGLDELNFHARVSYGFLNIYSVDNDYNVNNINIQLFVSIPFMNTDDSK